MIEKKWVFIGIGVFIVVVGMVSWGVATDWKFFGDNSNKSGGGSEPTPPSQPTDNCEGKCKENEICCQSLRDGTTKKCCPNTMSDPVFDGDKCCSRNNIVNGKCCDNPSLLKNNTNLPAKFNSLNLKSSSFSIAEVLGDQKMCCDGSYPNKDSKGCYQLCGGKNCYYPNICEPTEDANGFSCVANQNCKWIDLPMENPSKIIGDTCNPTTKCKKPGLCNTTIGSGNCEIQTVGINIDNEFQNQRYKFLTNPIDDSLPKKGIVRYEKQIDVQTSDAKNCGKTGNQSCSCDKKDCTATLDLYNVSYITMSGEKCIGEMKVGNSAKQPQCPLTDSLRCCPVSDTNGTFSGQMCDQDKVCTINKNIPTRGNGYLSECVDKKDCVDSNGKICGGNGYCQYVSSSKNGKCICDTPPNVNNNEYCNTTTMPFHLYEYDISTSPNSDKKATWRMIPFKTCGNDICNVQYFGIPASLSKDIKTTLEENLPDYEVINDYQIYQIIDNGLGPTYPPRALTITGDLWGSSWTSIVNDTGNKSSNGGFDYDRVFNSFILYKKKDKSISDGIYIFAFGYWMRYAAGISGASWLQIKYDISVAASSTPTQFYFKKAGKCCESDKNCNTYQYCQIPNGKSTFYGIDNTSQQTCTNFDNKMQIDTGQTTATICQTGFYQSKTPCSLNDGQQDNQKYCLYRCTNQQSSFCWNAHNQHDNNGIDTCICQRSTMMSAKPYKWNTPTQNLKNVFK
jgi:hypothetical protein